MLRYILGTFRVTWESIRDELVRQNFYQWVFRHYTDQLSPDSLFLGAWATMFFYIFLKIEVAISNFLKNLKWLKYKSDHIKFRRKYSLWIFLIFANKFVEMLTHVNCPHYLVDKRTTWLKFCQKFLSRY